MRVELLYLERCPAYERLMPRLRRLLDDAGVQERVELVRVDTLRAAEGQRFLGSPTVRIDGEDVDPSARARSDYGLKCRLYRGAQGQQAVPPDEWIRAAIDRAHEERRERGRDEEPGVVREALGIVLRREHLRKTLKIAFIVGCVLTAINQLDVFVNGNATAITFVKTGLNFCVPFVVSNLGLLAGKRAEKEAGATATAIARRSDSGVLWDPDVGKAPTDGERSSG